MSAYSRTINLLNQKNSALKKDLATEETQIGFIYLDDAACSKEDAERYGELKADLQQLMTTMTEISGLETKKKDLSSDIDAAKSELAGLVAKESGLMLTLGIALYGQSGAAEVPSFSRAYQDAAGFAEKITSLKTQAEQMTESLELQNVFSRVVTKVKINSLSLSINSQQKKLDSALITGAKAVVEAQDLPAELKCPAYETCVAFKNDWNKARITLEALQDELQNVEVTLADYGKKSLVQENIDAKNAEIEAFAFQTGHTFDKKYITRDGETLTDFPGKYAEPLSRVLALRVQLASVNRRLDILQYSEQVDAADHAREAMAKEVSVNEDRIRKLEAQNADLAQRIKDNAAAAEDLRAHRAAVEKEEGVSAEELAAMGEAEAVKPAEKAAELARQAGEGLKKAATATEKAAVKAAESVKKVAGKKKAAPASKAPAPEEPVDDEEAEFLSALNAAKASAAQSEDAE